MLKRFLHIYELQKQGIAFETPQALLQHVDLYEATQQTLQSFIEVSPHTGYTQPPAWAHASGLLQRADLLDSRQILQSLIAVSCVGQTQARVLKKPAHLSAVCHRQQKQIAGPALGT